MDIGSELRVIDVTEETVLEEQPDTTRPAPLGDREDHAEANVPEAG